MLELESEKYALTSSTALTSAVSVDFPDEALTPLSGRSAPIFTESTGTDFSIFPMVFPDETTKVSC